MKKLILIFLIQTIFLCSCSYNSDSDIALDNNKKSANNSIPKNTINTEYEVSCEPDYAISVHSMQELSEMKNYLKLSDKDLYSKLLEIEGGSVVDRNDISMFLELIESLPQIDMIDGETTWISYRAGLSVDTSELYEIVYWTVKKDNGDWIRYEYLLDRNPYNYSIDTSSENIVFDPFLSNENGNIKILAKSIKNHPIEKGNITRLYMAVNNLYVRAVCYTQNEDAFDIESCISGLDIYTLKEIGY